MDGMLRGGTGRSQLTAVSRSRAPSRARHRRRARPQAERGVDLPGRARGVERVEVQPRHAGIEQVGAELGGQLHPFLAHRLGATRARGQPAGAPASSPAPPRPWRPGGPWCDSEVTGRIPGSTGVSTPRSRRSATQPLVLGGLEEELRDPEVGQRQLGRQEVAVARQCRASADGRPGGPPRRRRSRRWPGPARPAPPRRPARRGRPSGSSGGSPPRAMRFSTPALRSDTRMSASSRRVWATQMRWAIGLSVRRVQHAATRGRTCAGATRPRRGRSPRRTTAPAAAAR